MDTNVEELADKLETVRSINNASSIAAALAAATSLAHSKLDSALRPAADAMVGLATQVGPDELSKSLALLNKVKNYPKMLRLMDFLGKVSKPALALAAPVIFASSLHRQNIMEDMVKGRLDALESKLNKSAAFRDGFMSKLANIDEVLNPKIEELSKRLELAKSINRASNTLAGLGVGTVVPLAATTQVKGITDRLKQHPRVAAALMALGALSNVAMAVGFPATIISGAHRQGVMEDLTEAKFEALGMGKSAATKVGFMSKLANIVGVGGDYDDPKNIYDIDDVIEKMKSSRNKGYLKALGSAIATGLLHHKGFNKLKYLTGGYGALSGLSGYAAENELLNNQWAKAGLVGHEDPAVQEAAQEAIIGSRPRYIPDALFYKQEYRDKFFKNVKDMKKKNPERFKRVKKIIGHYYPKYDLESRI